MADSQVPEGFELRKDGTVMAVIDDVRYKLRRPKIGEQRKLTELLYDIQEQSADLANQRQAKAARIAELEQEDGEDHASLLRQLNIELREALNRTRDLNVEWLRAAFDVLADKSLPPDDDLPSWVQDASSINALTVHWRTAPLVRGVPAN